MTPIRPVSEDHRHADYAPRSAVLSILRDAGVDETIVARVSNVLPDPFLVARQSGATAMTGEIEQIDRVCSRCNGTGSYMYDENHGKLCEDCCPCDEGWWLLLTHYGESNGKYACNRGCGKTVWPWEVGVEVPQFVAALSATPIEALQQRVEMLEVALRRIANPDNCGCVACGDIAESALGDDVG